MHTHPANTRETDTRTCHGTFVVRNSETVVLPFLFKRGIRRFVAKEPGKRRAEIGKRLRMRITVDLRQPGVAFVLDGIPLFFERVNSRLSPISVLALPFCERLIVGKPGCACGARTVVLLCVSQVKSNLVCEDHYRVSITCTCVYSCVASWALDHPSLLLAKETVLLLDLVHTIVARNAWHNMPCAKCRWLERFAVACTESWIPACAGMTSLPSCPRRRASSA